MPKPRSRPKPEEDEKSLFSKFVHVFQYTPRAMGIVWSTSRTLTLFFGALTLLMGISPAASAYVGKLIVDQVLFAAESQVQQDAMLAFWFVSIEAMIVTVDYAASIGLNVARALLRQQLGHRVNVMILEKSLKLELTQFEDSEFYDKLSQARRGASSRPLNLALGTFTAIESLITLVSASAILWTFSGWIIPLFLLAALPQFFAQTHFSGESFRLFKWRSPENREQRYLENVIAREDFAKEVKLLGIGDILLGRYVDIFDKVYAEDRRLTILKNVWGMGLQTITTVAFYGAYIWVVVDTVAGEISIGDMTMYIMLIGNGQRSIARTLSSIGSLYDDNLYLSTLYELLDEPTSQQTGGVDVGADCGAGVAFENVSFAYPGQTELAVKDLTLALLPGERLALVGENGSGKTTLIKLLTGLYAPTAGRIFIDGTELSEWNRDALHARISVIFQDFVRYQFTVGENIGVGDVEHFEDSEKWVDAAERGMAADFIDGMEDGYDTRLGRWFKNGRELSGGQWQKVALSRAFMRNDADILIFDEPTSAMDAKAEAEIFERIKAMTDEQMAILISHRFSTVRMADRIVVLDDGRILEAGTHEELVELGGRYATLFELQAKGYR